MCFCNYIDICKQIRRQILCILGTKMLSRANLYSRQINKIFQNTDFLQIRFPSSYTMKILKLDGIAIEILS